MINKNINSASFPNSEYIMIKKMERSLPISRGDNGFMTTKEVVEKMNVSQAFADDNRWGDTYKINLINNIMKIIERDNIPVYFLDAKKEGGKWLIRRKRADAGQSERCVNAVINNTQINTKYNCQMLKEVIFSYPEFYGNIWSAERMAASYLNDPSLFRCWIEDGILWGVRIGSDEQFRTRNEQPEQPIQPVQQNIQATNILSDDQIKKLATYIVDALIQKITNKI